jgi:SHS2 domain-containing protein
MIDVGIYRFLEDVALADCALEIESADLSDLFATAARALADLMVDPATVARTVEETIEVAAPTRDLLLFEWLGELIFRKDRDAEVFPDAEVRVEGAGPFRLVARVRGGRIDPARTERRADPKAVTFHRLAVEPTPDGWLARVVIDV